MNIGFIGVGHMGSSLALAIKDYQGRDRRFGGIKNNVFGTFRDQRGARERSLARNDGPRRARPEG